MRTQVVLTESSLDIPAVIAAVGDPTAGAIATFIGTVRRSSSVQESADRDVVALFYDAHHSLAEERLEEIVKEAAEHWDLAAAAIAHRVGRCELEEPTVAIACSSAHREAAFESCRWIIETLKASVPIWKREIYSDGASWVGMGS